MLVGARRLEVGGGRALVYDDVGDPGGVPVVYLHGTPDSRAARHPDDGVAGELGIRLLAVDRPGFGGTSPDPSGDGLARDVARLLDELAATTAGVLGWSSGGLAGLAVAARLGPRVHSLVLVGALPPVEAYVDPAVLAALGTGRRAFVEMALELGPEETAAEVGPHLVPDPLTPELARDHVLEGAGAVGRRELDEVPGALDRLVAGLEGAVAQGTVGIEHDLRHQLAPGLDLAAVVAPVRTVHGELDPVSPPAVGAWLAERLRAATVEVVPGAAHHLLFPRWAPLLEAAARPG